MIFLNQKCQTLQKVRDKIVQRKSSLKKQTQSCLEFPTDRNTVNWTNFLGTKNVKLHILPTKNCQEFQTVRNSHLRTKFTDRSLLGIPNSQIYSNWSQNERTKASIYTDLELLGIPTSLNSINRTILQGYFRNRNVRNPNSPGQN